jgi:hypothetical protein
MSRIDVLKELLVKNDMLVEVRPFEDDAPIIESDDIFSAREERLSEDEAALMARRRVI